MPVSSAIPAVSRASLQQAQAAAEQAVADVRQQAVQERQGVKAALKDVRMILSKIGSDIKSARDQAGHPDTRQALARDLKSIRNLDANAPLRLKGERLKPLESSSIWKQCVGYGKDARNNQAVALAKKHGLDVTAQGGQVTRAGLQAAQQQAVDNDVRVAEQAFDAARSVLQPVLQKALAFDATVQPIPARADALIRILHDEVVGSVASVPREVQLTHVYDVLRGKINASVDSRLKAARAEVDDQRVQAQHALSAFDRQARIASRASALSGLVTSDPAQRRRDRATLEKELKILMGDWAFGAVFHTNKGCRAVQEMCRGERSGLNGKTIKAEIESRLGDDTFARGEKPAGATLVAYADSLDRHAVNSITNTQRKLALTRYAEGGPVQTTHRQATHTPTTVAMLARMAGTQQLLRPQQFLSTAMRVEDTVKYPVTASAGSEKVKFVISGFSGLPLGSRYGFAGDGPERVYTPQSAFKVAAVKRENDAYVVTLYEVPAAREALQNATVLTC